jgi:hypothetical protein
MRTAEPGVFRKVGECLYRYSSNGVYYARFKADGKEIRRSLETTESVTKAIETQNHSGVRMKNISLMGCRFTSTVLVSALVVASFSISLVA